MITLGFSFFKQLCAIPTRKSYIDITRVYMIEVIKGNKVLGLYKREVVS